MFSKTCEYGIRAMIYIARQSGEEKRSSLTEISAAIDSPVSFTAKILQSLANDGLIHSVKGAHGGYEMSPFRQTPITLFHVVRSIDGDKIYNGCGLGLKQCNEQNPCPVHDQFKEVRNSLKVMLESTTILDLANKVSRGSAVLKV